MSGAVPYVAPWQTGFDRFAVQLYTPKQSAINVRQLTVPDGQWWRIIYLTGEYITSAAALTRIMVVEVTNPALPANFAYIGPSTLTQTASTSVFYTFGPNLGQTALPPTATTVGLSQQSLPDLLWAPRSIIEMTVIGVDPGDGFSGAGIFAIEVYTEKYPGVLTPTPTPVVP